MFDTKVSEGTYIYLIRIFVKIHAYIFIIGNCFIVTCRFTMVLSFNSDLFIHILCGFRKVLYTDTFYSSSISLVN